MGNKQLLERAAKAAGIEHDGYTINGLVILGEDRHFVRYWNPTESYADAFRLMVDCTLAVVVDTDHVAAGHSHAFDEYKELFADHNNDKHAATRMAIVKAAAQSQENT